MRTPIFDFVKHYAERDCARFHMPGHKGRGFLGVEALDITEIEGADVLYQPKGIIAESEENATSLFETAHTYYSAEGSTLAIKAMLALAVEQAKGERPILLAARNAHKAFLYAAALLDISVHWLTSEDFSHPCHACVTPESVRGALAAMEKKPHAVYITSPDYLGQTADIRGIAAVCDAYGVPLLVDNAHGAYLAFLSPTMHPIALGATASCDSAHKTLPALTGSAYLHISKKAPDGYLRAARRMLSLFASTSPSYLILASLDRLNRYLAEEMPQRLSRVCRAMDVFKERLTKLGYTVLSSEPLKTVIRATDAGYMGITLAAHLRKYAIECEFADGEYLVLMASSETDEDDFIRLNAAFEAIPPKAPIERSAPPFSLPRAAMSIRDAMLAPQESVSINEALGRICAAPTVSCPPAVPILMSGEVVDANAINLLRFYGIDQIDVVK